MRVGTGYTVQGKVHRASKVLLSVGGKGQGCARAAADCAQHAVTVAQFMGGDAGEFLQQQMATWGVEQVRQSRGNRGDGVANIATHRTS